MLILLFVAFLFFVSGLLEQFEPRPAVEYIKV